MVYCLLFKKIFSFICFRISVCAGSSLLCECFLWLRHAGLFSICGVRASHCGGFSSCGAQALGLSSCGSGGPVALWLVGMKPVCPAMTGRFPTTELPEVPCVVSFFQFAGEFFLHPGALVEDTATVCASPHGGRVPLGPTQSVLPGWLCDAGREVSPAVTERA